MNESGFCMNSHGASRATVSGRRLLLVGGEAAALLVAFAVLAAGALRRDLASARRRLTWHGARRWQRVVLTATESTAVGLGGAAAGWVIGSAAGAVAASVAGAPVGAVLSESASAASCSARGRRARGARDRRDGLARRARAGGSGRSDAAGAAVVAVPLSSQAGRSMRGSRPAARPAVLLPSPAVLLAAAVVASRFLPGGTVARATGSSRPAPCGVSVALLRAAESPRPLALAVGWLCRCRLPLTPRRANDRPRTRCRLTSSSG